MSPNASLDSAKGPSDGLKESTRACFDDFKNVILAFGKADSQSPCDDDDDDVNAAETAFALLPFPVSVGTGGRLSIPCYP